MLAVVTMKASIHMQHITSNDKINSLRQSKNKNAYTVAIVTATALE